MKTVTEAVASNTLYRLV